MLAIDDVLHYEALEYLDDLYEAGEYEVSELFLQLTSVFFLDGGQAMALLQDWMKERTAYERD